MPVSNPYAGEGAGPINYDDIAPLVNGVHVARKALITECITAGCTASCGIWRPDGKLISVERATELAQLAGWVRLGFRKWKCEGCALGKRPGDDIKQREEEREHGQSQRDSSGIR